MAAESPQAVAMLLLEKIAQAENWGGSPPAGATGYSWQKTRAEILDTYRECLAAATHLAASGPGSP